MAVKKPHIRQLLADSERIVFLDGGLGTIFQARDFTEQEFRGERFVGHTVPVKGLYDLLNLTHPKAVEATHRLYLAAGADIISTNTFRSSPLDLELVELESLCQEICGTAAEIAVATAAEYTRLNPRKPRYVAGILGPTGFRLTPIAGRPKAEQPLVAREVLKEAYKVQVEALLDGRVDVLMLETVIDLEAAMVGIEAIKETLSRYRAKPPIWVSLVISESTDMFARGNKIAEVIQQIHRAGAEIIGVNCGAEPARVVSMVGHLDGSPAQSVACHPSAGLPDPNGKYLVDAQEFSKILYGVAERGWFDIVGGCCGTTPEFIAEMIKQFEGLKPRHKVARSAQDQTT